MKMIIEAAAKLASLPRWRLFRTFLNAVASVVRHIESTARSYLPDAIPPIKRWL
jgi:hypothetical protein